MGVMKMGNIVPRAGLKPTSLIPCQCATITPPRLTYVTTIPTPTSLFGSLPQSSLETTIYIYTELYIIHI